MVGYMVASWFRAGPIDISSCLLLWPFIKLCVERAAVRIHCCAPVCSCCTQLTLCLLVTKKTVCLLQCWATLPTWWPSCRPSRGWRRRSKGSGGAFCGEQTKTLWFFKRIGRREGVGFRVFIIYATSCVSLLSFAIRNYNYLKMPSIREMLAQKCH